MTRETATGTGQAAQALSLPEELLLALLNEESGYFHQVPGWNLNCAMVGAALAELSLILLDPTETGRPTLDPILQEIASEAEPHDARYWVERLAPRSESVISEVLDGLVRRQIIDQHLGEFYTFTKRHRLRTAHGDEYLRGGRLRITGRSAALIAQTASHYLEDSFPDPWKFDIDRYAPPRGKHVGAGYAPYGLGTHSCLGFRWANLHLAINLLMLTHYFKIELARSYKRLPMDPLPSQSPSNRLKFRLVEQRHELRV